jgi:hypothetical protein
MSTLDIIGLRISQLGADLNLQHFSYSLEFSLKISVNFQPFLGAALSGLGAKGRIFTLEIIGLRISQPGANLNLQHISYSLEFSLKIPVNFPAFLEAALSERMPRRIPIRNTSCNDVGGATRSVAGGTNNR